MDPGPVYVETDDAFSVCLRKLDAHFRADDNVPYERHVFRQIAPMQGKTADKFMVCLRKQARHFNFFGESLNENLRNQLAEKLADAELKKKLLEVQLIIYITREAALDKIRKLEASPEQAKQMVNPNQEPGTSTDMVGKTSGIGSKGNVSKTCPGK